MIIIVAQGNGVDKIECKAVNSKQFEDRLRIHDGHHNETTENVPELLLCMEINENKRLI